MSIQDGFQSAILFFSKFQNVSSHLSQIPCNKVKLHIHQSIPSMCTSGEMLNISTNVEHFKEKWPPVGHFECKSVQNRRCTSSMYVQSLCKSSTMLSENCGRYRLHKLLFQKKAKWPPVGHFEFKFLQNRRFTSAMWV